MNKFISFYDVLKEAIYGKEIIIRKYGGLTWEQYRFEGDPEDDYYGTTEPLGWNKDEPFVEWRGFVEDVLHNDNSHVDIIFDKTKPHTYPGDGYLPDCYNWHMSEHIEIVQN